MDTYRVQIVNHTLGYTMSDAMTVRANSYEEAAAQLLIGPFVQDVGVIRLFAAQVCSVRHPRDVRRYYHRD